MHALPELTPQLKQLRLSGILDSLDARNRQAIDSHLSYADFLALLIQDEVARREQKKLATRLRHGAYRIVLDGASYRAPRPTPEPTKSAVAKTPKKPSI